jgi:hypothetical protein
LLPHSHFAIAALAIVPATYALHPGSTLQNVGVCVLVGGIASAAIDLDIILRSRTEQRLRFFRNPVEIFRRFPLFMETITETGVLGTGMRTHLAMAAIIPLLFAYFADRYIVPVSIAVLSHILSDIPNMRRLQE